MNQLRIDFAAAGRAAALAKRLVVGATGSRRPSALSIALAVNLVADEMAGGRCEREVTLMCCHCYNRLDPRWEWSAHRAPDDEACLECGASGRAADGMLFVVRPRRPA